MLYSALQEDSANNILWAHFMLQEPCHWGGPEVFYWTQHKATHRQTDARDWTSM